MPTTFSVQYEGRTIEVVPDAITERDRVRLLVDGETVAGSKANGRNTVLAGDGLEVRAVMPFWGGSVTSASLVVEDGEIELEPEPGTRAARRAAFARAHPKLYASRHVVSGAAQVAAAIIGFTFLLGLLPDISIDLPDIPLPAIDLPDIPWPSVDLPDIAVPGWIKAIAESKQYWLPILVGLLLASRELKRRKQLRRG
ncbi:hypothetical protein DVA67_026975 [Solirubrobacter sp. CPCC 204708]|uniref:Uncharacterized protein n=1 Tax=Solirubrobacter deserti TaxID=2282478 RepID=A0ABT4RH22_9ACTN|nr:hypothetical protein [Solirubrobacter deserti]MBE2319641.1 hypothetical protein [Solirubrobacter deserti]MDA0137620.1 hypothetical protein [Solirubrobacter deserti]